jgi:Ca2+-binding RTX toxin-like protein
LAIYSIILDPEHVRVQVQLGDVDSHRPWCVPLGLGTEVSGVNVRKLLRWIALGIAVLGVAACDQFRPATVDIQTKPGKPWHSEIVNIRGTKGDDELAAYDQLNVQVRAFAGDDIIDLADAGGQNYVDAGPGNDIVYDSPFYDTIRLGDGNDTATHTGGNDMTSGDKGDDLIEVYVDEIFAAPDPPYDVGGPFVTRLDGGSGTDTVRFFMSQPCVDAGYDSAVAAAFEDWQEAGAPGELDLDAATESMSQPLNILLVDLEVLEIVNTTTNEMIYPEPPSEPAG